MTTETTTPEAWQLPTGMPRLFEGPAIAIRTAGNSCAIFAPSTGGTSVAGTWSLHQLPDNKIPLAPKTDADHFTAVHEWLIAERQAIAAWLLAAKDQSIDYWAIATDAAETRVRELREQLHDAKIHADYLEGELSEVRANRNHIAQSFREIRDYGQWLVAEARWLAEHPDSTNPAHLRFAADIIEQTNPSRVVARNPSQLRTEADRVEREQAEKAERDKVIEAVAERLYLDDERQLNRVHRCGWLDSSESNREAYRANVRALLAEFDITPKAGA